MEDVMKTIAVIFTVSLVACASPYKVCRSLDTNPYGLDEDAIQDGDYAKAEVAAKELHQAKFSNMSYEDFVKTVLGPSTIPHWRRYGSLEACVAAVEGERSANWAALNQGLQNGIEQHQAIQRESLNQSVIWRPAPSKAVTCNTFCFTPENCQTRCE